MKECRKGGWIIGAWKEKQKLTWSERESDRGQPEATSHWIVSSFSEDLFPSLLFSNFSPVFTSIAPSVWLHPFILTACLSL